MGPKIATTAAARVPPSKASPSPRQEVAGRPRAARWVTLALAALLALPALLAAGCGMKSATSGHSISGTVTGEVTAGVTITLAGATGSLTTTTGAGGGYSFAGLNNGEYLATASLEGYGFTPHAGLEVTLVGVDLTGQDFLATATHHAITGAVTGVASAGVRLDLTGAATATATSAADGSYAFPGMVAGTYTVTPTLAGHGFSPGARTVTLGSADAVGQDFLSSLSDGSAHAISGAVTGAVLAGVTITLQRGTTVLEGATTGADGAFTLAALADGVYRLTPERTGFSFTPRSLEVTLNGADAPGQAFSAAVSVAAAPVEELGTGGHLASGIAIGNDLNAWITDAANGVVSRVLLQDTADGARGDVLDLQLSPGDGQPTAIALRYFGLRCYTETRANRVGCVNWNGTEVFSVAIPTPASGASDIINGPGLTQLTPDMWFTEHDAGKIGRLRITEVAGVDSGAVVAEYDLPAGCQPTSLAWTGGNVWWAAEGCGRVGWIDPATGAVTTVPVEVGRPIALAPNHGEAAVWLIDAAGDRLGRLTAAGGLTWYSPVVAGSQLAGVALGPDKTIYVTARAANAIARFPLAAFDPRADPNAGRLTDELPLPTAGAQPTRITAGTDGNVWFTEEGQAKIGVVYLPTHCLMGKATLADLATPVAGVTLTLSGAAAATGLSDDSGNYAFCDLLPGSYTLTPAQAARTFSPATQVVTLGRSNRIVPAFVAQ